MYMHKETFELYTKDNKNLIKDKCVEIDDMIAPIIQILNRKGYFTGFCCSTHYPVKNYGMHIMFKDFYEVSIPEGFTMSPVVLLECAGTKIHCPKNMVISDYLYALDLVKILYKWAVELKEPATIDKNVENMAIEALESNLCYKLETFDKLVKRASICGKLKLPFTSKAASIEVCNLFDKGYISKVTRDYYVLKNKELFDKINEEAFTKLNGINKLNEF